MTAPQKGQRGFELDAHLTFSRPLPREEALRFLSPWLSTSNLRATLYGQEEVPSVRLTGRLERDELRRLLQVGLEGGVLRGAEVGLRGFLRSPEGSTDYVPWTRNKVLPRAAWSEVALAEGVKYILE